VEKNLTAEKFSEWKGLLRKWKVDVYIPRFKLKTRYSLVETLTDMGMPTAFTEKADFSGIDGTRSLSIGDVIHQAFVEVDEEGTEAAAATAVTLVLETSLPPSPPVFRADRPFIFVIQERKSGNILFLGRVANPA
ncbi:MAG TPA: serpin family protein, partial [Candidatus Moranbacteria bacterium]|nr:serpin family protein [Candidatus Moranbacteria bacterium]